MLRRGKRHYGDDGVRWYALDVARQKEYLAGYILNRMGFETFIPTETRWRKRNRYAKAKVEIAFAAVPGVIFVALPLCPDWLRVMGISVVTGVLSIGDVPTPVDAEELGRYRATQLDGRMVVERRRVRAKGGGEVERSERLIHVQGRGVLRAPKEQRHMRSNREVHVGEHATIAEGPFRFVTVTVQKIAGERARVLLPLFGADGQEEGGVRMTVPLSDLEAVA